MITKGKISIPIAYVLWIYLLLLSKPVSVFAVDLGDTSGFQNGSSLVVGPSYPINQDSYFTDDTGNILMFVNVLGQVARPGQFIVRESADFSTILAITGGISNEANLGHVLVVRQEPDDNGKQAYIINLKSFYKKGDRSGFIALKPNDTIIIPEKNISLTKLARLMSITYPIVNLYDILNRN